jgi:hypothetical protein
MKKTQSLPLTKVKNGNKSLTHNTKNYKGRKIKPMPPSPLRSYKM